MRCIITAVGVELPILASNPGQNTALDRAEIGADQCPPGRRNDHAAAAIAHHGERARIQFLHVRIIAGGDRSDGGVEIFDDRTLQVLRLEALAAPTSS